AYRESLANTTVFTGSGRFVGPKQVEVAAADGSTTRITGDDIVIATGARPLIPAIDGLDQVEYHTSDTVMRVAELPRRLIVLGGGYIATEMAHVFASLGSEVTIVNRSARLLAR
ncbi:MAG TPA: FAD-dependent oxidoreductase, partial [Ilumatobacteraceae bacterium]|nr:FAD-dependent oxidoreductase [Ilumatobacteraceae bacterium]